MITMITMQRCFGQIYPFPLSFLRALFEKSKGKVHNQMKIKVRKTMCLLFLSSEDHCYGGEKTKKNPKKDSVNEHEFQKINNCSFEVP